MRWSGRVAAIVVTAVVVGFGAACTRSTPTVLHVDITGLPPTAAGKVAVSGPRDQYTITATDERRVTPGGFRLAIEPVTIADTTYYPADDTTNVSVPEGQTVRVAAAYRVAIPRTTKVLDPVDPGITQVRAEAVTFRAGARQVAGLKPGDHLIAGDGPQVHGLLVRKVVAVRTTGGQTVVTTQPAALDEALPSGVVRLNAQQGLRILKPAAHVIGPAADDPLAEFEFSLKLKHGFCKRTDTTPDAITTAGSIKYQLHSLHLPIGGDLDWKPFPPGLSVSVHAGLEVEQTIEGNISAAISCSVKKDVELPFICGSVIGEMVRIGPVSFDCEFKVGAKVTVEAKANWQLGPITSNPSISFNAGFSSSHGVTSDHDFDAGTHSGPTNLPELSASVKASAFLKIGLVAKDPTGTAELSGAFEISAGPSLEVASDGLTAKFEVRPKIVFEATFDAVLKDFSQDAEMSLPKWSTELFHVGRGDTTARPEPSPIARLPQALPDDLQLPNLDPDLLSSVNRSRTEPWLLAGCGSRTMPSDGARTAMVTGQAGLGDAGSTIQVGVYPTAQAAQRAYGELRDAAPLCHVDGRSRTRSVTVGSEGLRYSVFQKYDPVFADNPELGTLLRYVLVRAGNAIVVVDQFSDLATVQELNGTGDTLVDWADAVVDQLCVGGFACE